MHTHYFDEILATHESFPFAERRKERVSPVCDFPAKKKSKKRLKRRRDFTLQIRQSANMNYDYMNNKCIYSGVGFGHVRSPRATPVGRGRRVLEKSSVASPIFDGQHSSLPRSSNGDTKGAYVPSARLTRSAARRLCNIGVPQFGVVESSSSARAQPSAIPNSKPVNALADILKDCLNRKRKHDAVSVHSSDDFSSKHFHDQTPCSILPEKRGEDSKGNEGHTSHSAFVGTKALRLQIPLMHTHL